MKLNINSVLLLAAVGFVISVLYLLISMLGFIDLGYQKSNGNPVLFLASSALALLTLFLIIGLLVVKFLRKVKQ